MEINVIDYLRNFKEMDCDYVPNPGNAGDSLIAAGTIDAFSRANVKYEFVRPKYYSPKKSATLIYGGGGNLVGLAAFSTEFLSNFHRKVHRLVILPHTIKEISPLLQEFGSNVDIFCREETTYAYVQSNTNKANVYLAHDMAFCLDAQDFLASSSSASVGSIGKYFYDRFFERKNIPAFRNFMKARKTSQLLKASLKQAGGGDVLNAYRLDGESKGGVLPKGNVDVSLVFDFGTENEEVITAAVRSVFTFLNNFKTINTDRLHIAVSGALLGLDVNFFGNNYYKCEAVYNYSMKDRFPNVKWME